MQHFTYTSLSSEKIDALCQRPKMDFAAVFGQVQPIIYGVQADGDEAVLRYTQQFDGHRPDPLAIDPASVSVTLDEDIKAAIDTAFANIRRFHKAQQQDPLEVVTMPGIRCRRITRPIDRVGLYVPGGTALLPSTLLMLGVPAMLAGCDDIVIATPPNDKGGVGDELIYIAQKIGAAQIVQAGGAQAVAAMAWGTESVTKVDKIFGPGNQYVTAAKMILQNSEAQIAIDMPAGPSEVLVIADSTATPAFVAADLLSQAEHGGDSQVVLAATDTFDLNSCLQEIERQLGKLPRQDAARKALENSYTLTVDSVAQAIAFSNRYAPEHLIIQCEQAAQFEADIRSAGSVFLGHWSPESVGDYASGTNHTLPTYGYARMYSGVSLQSYQKFITVQELSQQGLKTIAPTVTTLAELEKLEAHKQAVAIRMEKLTETK